MSTPQIILQLNSLEQKAKTQRLFIFLLLVILIVTSLVQFSEILQEKLYLVSYLLLVSAMAVKLTPNLRGKYSYIKNEADLTNQDFIKKLKAKMAFDTKHLVLFLLLATLSLNFALLGMYYSKGTLFNFEFNASNRLVIHLSTIIILVLGYYVNKKKLKSNQEQLEMVLSQLEGIK